MCDDIIVVTKPFPIKTVPTKTISTKTIPTDCNKEKVPCKMENVYILLTLLLTTILLLNTTLLLTTLLFPHKAMIQKKQIISIARHH